MSTRNRELVFLVPALVLTTLGFALVYTQKSSVLTLSSLTYGALFLALFAIAHIGRRVLAPYADPYLLPITALLSTLGILFLYRLNEKLALQQAMWLVVGLAAFLLVLVFVRDLKVLRDYRFLIGIAGLLLLLLTAVFGREINGARLWVAFGPIRFQPAEFGKILLMVFFAAYLVDIREALTVSTRRVLGVPLPPFRYLAPLLTIWVLSMMLMIFMKDLGTSLLFFGALLALLYVATGRVFYVVGRNGAVHRRRGSALLHFPPCADPYRHLARSLERPHREGLSDRPVLVRAGSRGPVRPRLGPGVSASCNRAIPSSPLWRPTSSSPPSGRSWDWWGRWASSSST